MEFHKPKPWHGWREFLREYLIVVVRVMTALGAEQLVEWMHWRHEVAETRRALNQEVAFDLASAEWRMRAGACENRRLDSLDRWWASWREGRPLKLTGPIGPRPPLIYREGVWHGATGAALAQLPVEERNRYATFYDYIDVYQTIDRLKIEPWTDLAKMSFLERLDDYQLAQLKTDISALRGINRLYDTNIPFVRSVAGEVGVTASAAQRALHNVALESGVAGVEEQMKQAALDECQPILAGAR